MIELSKPIAYLCTLQHQSDQEMQAISAKVEEHKQAREKQAEWTMLFKEKAKTPVHKVDL